MHSSGLFHAIHTTVMQLLLHPSLPVLFTLFQYNSLAFQRGQVCVTLVECKTADTLGRSPQGHGSRLCPPTALGRRTELWIFAQASLPDMASDPWANVDTANRRTRDHRQIGR